MQSSPSYFLYFFLKWERRKNKEQEFLGSCSYANIYDATVTSLRQCESLKIEVANKARLS